MSHLNNIKPPQLPPSSKLFPLLSWLSSSILTTSSSQRVLKSPPASVFSCSCQSDEILTLAIGSRTSWRCGQKEMSDDADSRLMPYRAWKPWWILGQHLNEVKSWMSRLMSPPAEGVGFEEKSCEAAMSSICILLVMNRLWRGWASFDVCVWFVIPLGFCCFELCFGFESLGVGMNGDSCNLSCEIPVSSSGSCVLGLLVSMVRGFNSTLWRRRLSSFCGCVLVWISLLAAR